MSEQTIHDSSVESLEQFIQSRNEPAWLADVRRAALEQFRDMEWPTAQDEEFRRSDVSSYDFDAYTFEVVPGPRAEVENPVGQSGSLQFNGTSLVRRSLAEGLAEKGVQLISLEEALASGLSDDLAEQVRSALLAGVENADNRLSLWHYATITHGAIVFVPRFVELKEPFVLSFDEAGTDILRSPQIIAIADEGARFSVVSRVRGAEEGEVLINEGVDVVVGNAGQIEYFGMQNVNIDSSVISNGVATIGRDATFRGYAAVFGGMFSKYRLDAVMAGEGADAFLGGVYFPHEDQHIDLRTVQRHVSPKAHSLTLYKGAITDEAHSVYQGLISVDHDALNTDAYLTNNNLILGDDAQADSIPTLQINTDEVRCSHGSTIGKLDAGQIYYLETRGYSPDEAKRLLVQGYFEAILGKYPETVSDEIHLILADRIGE
ncbi:MAG: SufD family Fe-S cluster assembly protein [Spirochaeta sp.]|jgi:Fe-S cluster assembly protein SufD|nr:SufD family Fe-S cluster assembly protein [Spirochaeta sp.]